MATMEPGQLIVPHGPDEPKPSSDSSPQPEQPVAQPVPTPAPLPEPAPEPSAAPAQAPAEPTAAALAPAPSPVEASQPPEEPAASWQYRRASEDSSATPPPTQGVQWSASEFIDHEKNIGWYGMVVLGGLIAAALIYLLTKDKLTTGIIVFVVIAFTAFAAKSKPKIQQYALNPYGLQIGQKAYAFQDFKTFSVVDEGAIASIVFMPLKRFMPPLTIYVSPDIEPQVVDFLAAYLPLETHKTDAVDSLMRRLRF